MGKTPHQHDKPDTPADPQEIPGQHKDRDRDEDRRFGPKHPQHRDDVPDLPEHSSEDDSNVRQ